MTANWRIDFSGCNYLFFRGNSLELFTQIGSHPQRQPSRYRCWLSLQGEIHKLLINNLTADAALCHPPVQAKRNCVSGWTLIGSHPQRQPSRYRCWLSLQDEIHKLLINNLTADAHSAIRLYRQNETAFRDGH